jgi:hypothetical protein
VRLVLQGMRRRALSHALTLSYSHAGHGCRLEIFHKGEWGAIEDPKNSKNAGQVACEQVPRECARWRDKGSGFDSGLSSGFSSGFSSGEGRRRASFRLCRSSVNLLVRARDPANSAPLASAPHPPIRPLCKPSRRHQLHSHGPDFTLRLSLWMHSSSDAVWPARAP